ncbi:MAG TPA: rhomboid family intramembrane serine protease [Blastocatellia bacterium]|nr:rhomboid family intramembrane serine protease [Blastocatellia bacterium]
MTDEAPKNSLRICKSCGSLTPANSAKCVQCGSVAGELALAQDEALRETQFARSFFSRGNPFTWIFFGANIGIFLLTCFAGGAENYILVAFGAKLNSYIAAGQYWRLITPVFIHAGLVHLLVNMYALYALGPSVERLYGSPKFVILYLGSGIASIAASYLFPWVNVDEPSVGASGALFGLIGVLTVFGFKYRDELPGQFKRAFGARLIPIIILNLAIGLAIPMIDNSAHIGGLVAGGLLASVIPYKRQNPPYSHWAWRALQGLLLALTLFCFIKAWSRYEGPHLSIHTFKVTWFPGQEEERKVEAMLEAFNDASKSFALAYNTRDPEATKKAIEELNNTPKLEPEIFKVKERERFENLRTRALDMLTQLQNVLQQAKTEGHDPDNAKLAELRCERNQWIEDYRKFGEDVLRSDWNNDPEEDIKAPPLCSDNNARS